MRQRNLDAISEHFLSEEQDLSRASLGRIFETTICGSRPFDSCSELESSRIYFRGLYSIKPVLFRDVWLPRKPLSRTWLKLAPKPGLCCRCRRRRRRAVRQRVSALWGVTRLGVRARAWEEEAGSDPPPTGPPLLRAGAPLS